MNIIQITPALPPIRDGVGDYSFKLAKRLLENYGILTHFVTCQREFQPPIIEDFPVAQLPNQSPTEFLKSLPDNIDKILLQYTDFYDPKYGTPFWLVEALEAAKEQKKIELLVMFHEFPNFYLWHKRFFLFPLQSFVAWRVAKLADIVFTNNSISRNSLAKGLSQPISSIPVFSNVGEPKHLPLLENRKRRIVVFGTYGRRRRIYQRATAMLVNICRFLEIEEICDVGPSLNLKKSEIEGIPLVEMGEKSDREVSDIMLDSLAGIAYSIDNRDLAKSGVFATYCAHGVVPIITYDNSSQTDGIEVGKHFLYAGSKSKIYMENLQYIADEAHKWYKNHNLSRTAEVFASQFFEGISRS